MLTHFRHGPTRTIADVLRGGAARLEGRLVPDRQSQTPHTTSFERPEHLGDNPLWYHAWSGGVMVEAEGQRFPFEGVEAVTPAVLETFPYEYAGRDALIEISTDEFTAVCPFSGLPDFGTLSVRYAPGSSCVELKSLKYYLTSYRTVGIYQEHAANRILDDLVACCRPRWMEVVLDYRLRGGIHTVVTVEHGSRPPSR